MHPKGVKLSERVVERYKTQHLRSAFGSSVSLDYSVLRQYNAYNIMKRAEITRCDGANCSGNCMKSLPG